MIGRFVNADIWDVLTIGPITPVGWSFIGAVAVAAVFSYAAPKVVKKINVTTTRSSNNAVSMSKRRKTTN